VTVGKSWFAAFLPCLLFAASSAAAAPSESHPRRVVSMNVCTDQLAMLLADEGQLASVSHMARQREFSVLWQRAGALTVNHGHAEEVYLMRPDLVLAGSYSTRVTVDLLRRLGVRVETFAPTSSLEDIRKDIQTMGRLLGQSPRAAAIVSAFDREVAALRASHGDRKPLAALYYANSYTSGRGTLAAEIVGLAGLDNLASRLGLTGTARLPLESLVMHAPEIIVTGQRYGGDNAQATSVLDHPALTRGGRLPGALVIADHEWICGLPFTIEAARRLGSAARAATDREAR
jgi:iron complex transport system substrate-binding protein